MTLKEFRKKATGTGSHVMLEELQAKVEFVDIQSSIELVGITSVYQFVIQQLDGFKKLELTPGSSLSNSIRFFGNLQKQLINFLEFSSQEELNGQLTRRWDELTRGYIKSSMPIFTSDSQETIILSKIEKESLPIATATYQYLVKASCGNISDHNNFTGYMLGYDIRMRDWKKNNFPILSSSKFSHNFQKKFEETIGSAEKDLAEHFKNTSDGYITLWDSIELQRKEEKDHFDKWFLETSETATLFNTNSKKTIEDLEETYSKKLMLSAPAGHWQSEADLHKKKGNLYLSILIGMILISAISLWGILIEAPENIYASWFGDDKSVAVRWTIVYITLIGLMAFTIKQLTKLMFSSYHLSRDCQERRLLTNFYLSLLKESAVEKEQQNLIMTSLFSRAETGLLKDDGSPAMPTDAIKSILGK